MRTPPRPSATARLVLGVAVAVLVVLSGALAVHAARPGPGTTADRPLLAVRDSAPAATAPAPASVPGSAPTSWAGSTVRTLLPNYNASIPGVFRSVVEGWRIGTPAFVPSTGTVWWPTVPVPVGGAPAPPTAPALLYNVSTEQFVGIDPSVANASAFVYDPTDGLLYATDPINNTVEEIDPATGLPTGIVYHVGSAPEAIAYDPGVGYLFVANSRSNNVTVIDPVAGTIPWPSVAVGHEPYLLADDARDGLMYVGNAGSNYLSRLSVTSPTSPEMTTGLANGPARGLAFATSSDILAVTTVNSTDLTAVNASSGDVYPVTVPVGTNFTGITTSINGSTFLLADTAQDFLAAVNTSTLAVSTDHLEVGLHPNLILTAPPSGQTLVWNNGSRNVSVIGSDLVGVASQNTTLGPTPDLLAFDAPLDRLFVADPALPGIEVIDPYTGGTEAPPIVLPSPPQALTLDSSTGSLYVGLSGAVAEFSASTGFPVVENRNLSGANAPLALDAENGLLWVGRSSSSEVVALSSTSLASAGPLVHVRLNSSDPYSLIAVPGNNSLFALNSSSDQVVQFNGTDGSQMGPIATVGTNSTALVWDSPDDLVYAAGDGLSAVAPATMAVVLTSAPLAPHAHVGGISYDASRQAIYVGTWSGPFSGSVSVVNGSSPAYAASSLTVVPTGFEPAALLTLLALSGGLTDSGVTLVADAGSGTISVLASPPQILSASFDPASIDAGASTRLVIAATGGADASTVAYEGLPTGCPESAAFSFNCTPTESGTFAVLVTVTDSLGESASVVVGLDVSSALRVEATVGALPSHELDRALSFAVSASATGGTPGYNYTWTFGNGASSDLSSTTYSYTTAGEYLVAVTVTDQGGGSAVNETIVYVQPDPAVTIDVAGGTTTDVDLLVDLSATVSGGVGPGTGSWHFGDGTTSGLAAVEHSWAKPGVYAVNYTYTDALGKKAKGSVNLLVDPPLGGNFSVVALSSSPVVGTKFDFNASLVNGTAGYTVVWTFGDGSTAVGTNVVHAYAAAGSYPVSVSAEDAVGSFFNASFGNLTVGPGPSRAGPLFGGGFGPSFVLGLVIGGTVAAVALFAAERTRRAGPSGPPSPYVPPPAQRGRP